MSKIKIVINSTPIISLSIIEKLDLLDFLFEEVIVPQAVYTEVVTRGTDKAGSVELARSKWVKVEKVLNENTKQSIMLELDEGEAEVITIAKERTINTVVIDEFAGRQYASLLGLNVIGTLGILLSGKKHGFIAELRPLMDTLIKKNRYIDKFLYELMLRQAGEVK